MKQYNTQRPVFLLLVLWCLGGNAISQNKYKTFRTLCYFPVKGITKLHYLDQGQTSEVALPRMNLSTPYKAHGNEPLVFGQIDQKDGKPIIIPMAKTKIPSSTQHAILLFLPAPKDHPLSFKILVIDYDKDKLRNGENLFINLSNEPVAGQFGKRKLLIPAKKQVKMNPVLDQDKAGRYFVNIRSQVNGKWRPLCKSYWRFNPKTRKLVLIFRDPKTNRLRLLSFPETSSQTDVTRTETS